MPDPADLRLVRVLAELGRVSAEELAERARLDVGDALARLSRLHRAGLPLVVGVEGDRTRLARWAAGDRWPPPPVTRTPAGPPSPAAPRTPPAPPVPVSDPWGPPQPATWATGPVAAAPVPAPGRVAAHRTPGVGDRLEAPGPTGPVALTLVDLVDTADALYAAGGHELAPGTRAAVVHTEVAAGPGGFPTTPDALLVLVLADGSEVAGNGATLSSRPPFPGPVAPRDTVGGHTLYELDADADIVAVRWRSAPGAPAVQWRV